MFYRQGILILVWCSQTAESALLFISLLPLGDHRFPEDITESNSPLLSLSELTESQSPRCSLKACWFQSPAQLWLLGAWFRLLSCLAVTVLRGCKHFLLSDSIWEATQQIRHSLDSCRTVHRTLRTIFLSATLNLSGHFILSRISHAVSILVSGQS